VVLRTSACRLRKESTQSRSFYSVATPPAAAALAGLTVMDILYPRCAGLDVHKEKVVACVRKLKGGSARQQVRTFRTETNALLEMADWLAAQEVTHVAMESTGVYWKPIWNLLEGLFELLLVNAEHIKQVPGRKTDVKDSQWIAELLQHGLLKPSFVPERPVRQLRELTRQRVQLVRQKVQVANRIQKTLEDANIKLSSVASDVLGASGRDMLKAIIRGEDDPITLANLARQRLRKKLPQLQEALCGEVEDHHRFLLGMLLEQVEFLEAQIDRMSGALSWQPRERRQAQERPDDEGEQVVAGGAGAVRLGGQPQQGDTPEAVVRAAGGSARQEARSGGGRSPAAGDHLQRAEEGAGLRGAGAGLREPPAGQGEAEAPVAEASGEVGGQGGGGRGGGVTASVDGSLGFGGSEASPRETAREPVCPRILRRGLIFRVEG